MAELHLTHIQYTTFIPSFICTRLHEHQGEWFIPASHISVTWSAICQKHSFFFFLGLSNMSLFISAHLFQPVKYQACWPLSPWVGDCFDLMNESTPNSPHSCLTFAILNVQLCNEHFKTTTQEVIIKPIFAFFFLLRPFSLFYHHLAIFCCWPSARTQVEIAAATHCCSLQLNCIVN